MTGPEVLTAEKQAANVLAADARRVRRLTRAMLGLWVVAGGLAALLFLFYWEYASPMIKKQKDEFGLKRLPYSTWNEPAGTDPALLARVEALNALYLTTQLAVVTAAAIGLLAASTFGTVLLVRAGQRATLRQVQASLADISAQLAALNRAGPAEPRA